MRTRSEDAALRRVFSVQADCDPARVDAAVEAGRAAYCAHEARLPLGNREFLWQQAGYLRKRWWAMQAAALAVLWLILRLGVRAEAARRCVGVLAPAFGMLMLPELWRNRSAGAVEVERAARFSLRQVYAARMLLFGMVDLALLSLFFAAAKLGARVELGALIVQFCVPLNVTCCICFLTLRARRIGSEGAVLALCAAWTAAWARIVLDGGLYVRVSGAAWCALLAASALGVLRCAAVLLRDCGTGWEASESWS